MDILPTFARPGRRPASGATARLTGTTITRCSPPNPAPSRTTKAFYYYSRLELQAVRSGPWKLNMKGELYNLEEDIGESQNVAGGHADVVARLNRLLDEARADLGDGARPGRTAGRWARRRGRCGSGFRATLKVAIRRTRPSTTFPAARSLPERASRGVRLASAVASAENSRARSRA